MKLTYIFVVIIASLVFSSCDETKGNDNKGENTVTNNKEQLADNKANEIADNNEVLEQTEVVTSADSESESEGNNGKVVKLSTEKFVNQIYDYKANPGKWVYKGDKPAIIDFYADWCGPCKRVAPIMDDLAKEYEGQINIYKIDTDKEKELAGRVFGIRSIPSILFIPAEGQPLMEVGAFPKQAYVNKINEYLIK